MKMNDMEMDTQAKGEGLRRLFMINLKDLYDAENQ